MVATNAGYPKFPAGTPLKETFNKPNYVGHEDDCTHFISYCIGRTASNTNVSGIDFAYKGGGLHTLVRLKVLEFIDTPTFLTYTILCKDAEPK